MMPFESLFQQLQTVLNMKCEDLQAQGVEHADPSAIWHYFVHEQWCDVESEEEMHIHQMVSDLLALTKQQYCTYIEQTSRKMTPFAELEEEEIAALLES